MSDPSDSGYESDQIEWLEYLDEKDTNYTDPDDYHDEKEDE